MSQRIVQTHIQKIADQLLATRQQTLDGIKSEAEARRRQEQVQSACSEMLGSFPERTPLNERTIERTDRDGYDLEILTFESIPGLLVTANLYIPNQQEPPYPGVLMNVGHWPEGKANGDHQRLARLFARRGMAALIIDHIGQGERIQLYDVTLRRSWLGQSVSHEHTHLGNLFFLLGRHPATFMLWDAIRALDLLANHGAIDPSHLGVTGACCGATLTRLLCALDSRLAAASSVIEKEQTTPIGGGDAEQNLFGALKRGITPIDQWQAFAPRKLLLFHSNEAREEEWLKETIAALSPWYDLFQAKKNLEILGAEGQAGFFRAARGMTVEFFANAFSLPDVRIRESQQPVDPPQRLNCTETGQVGNSVNALDWFKLINRIADEENLPPAFPAPLNQDQAKRQQEQTRSKMHPHLRMPEPDGPVTGEVEGHTTDWGLSVEKGRIFAEEDIYLPYSFYSEPEGQEGRTAKPAVLTLHERGLAAIAAQGLWMTQMSGGGCNIMAVDVRGTGETRLQSTNEGSDPYHTLLEGSEARWARRALHVGKNLFGARVFDALRALAYLRTRWDVVSEKISIVGVGRGALWALYAAALDENVERVVLLRGLTSYNCLIRHRRHNHHFSLYMPGVMKDFDLPQVAACIAPRPLTLLNPVQQRRERCTIEEVSDLYRPVAETYNQLGAADAFKIVNMDQASDTVRALTEGLGIQAKDSGWEQWGA